MKLWQIEDEMDEVEARIDQVELRLYDIEESPQDYEGRDLSQYTKLLDKVDSLETLKEALKAEME